MALKDYLLTFENEYELSEKQLSTKYIYRHKDLTKRRSYSMPDLLDIERAVDKINVISEHRHPNTQFSTRLTISTVDISSFLPKKKLNLKQKLIYGLRYLKRKPSVDQTHNSMDDLLKLDGVSTLIHKTSCKTVKHLIEKKSSPRGYNSLPRRVHHLRKNETQSQKWKSEGNLLISTDESRRLITTTRANESHYYKVHDMKRVNSHDGSFSEKYRYTDYYAIAVFLLFLTDWNHEGD